VLAYGEAAAPRAAGQSLASPGLTVTALSMDSHALSLRFGARHWQLLPDRQALWAWRDRAGAGGAAPLDGLWLGFNPRFGERRSLAADRGAPGLVWLSGEPSRSRPLPPGWRASGASGFLVEG
jgi:competence protein ComEC